MKDIDPFPSAEFKFVFFLFARAGLGLLIYAEFA